MEKKTFCRKMTSMNEERCVVLVGKTGNGKSSTGNAILGIKKFKAGKCLEAVTTTCSVETSQRLNGQPTYKICDTPGFYEADCNVVERCLEVIRSVTEFCPNPHVFLLVFSSADRINEIDNCTIDLLRVIFGEKMFDHCILVFTRGEEFDDEEQFEGFWKECPLFTTLAAMCGNRVVRIENIPKNKESGLDKLLKIIEEVSNNGSKTYEYEEIYKHVEELTQAVKLFDKKTEAWRIHVDKEEKIEYKTKLTEKIKTFLRIMDTALIRRIGSLGWKAGLVTTNGLLLLGVSAAVATGVGGAVVAASAVTAVGVGIAKAVSASKTKNQKAASEHHKEN